MQQSNTLVDSVVHTPCTIALVAGLHGPFFVSSTSCAGIVKAAHYGWSSATLVGSDAKPVVCLVVIEIISVECLLLLLQWYINKQCA